MNGPMRYRKKPVSVSAMQFTDETKDHALSWINGAPGSSAWADFDTGGEPVLKIETLEGVMLATFGDWIIRGVAGEFYPCKPNIFRATYDPIILLIDVVDT